LFKRAEGFVGGRRKLLKVVRETVLRAGVFAYRDRRRRKRDFRRLWILRVSAAARARGLRYSQFMNGLRRAGIELDRRSLSELAINDPAAFDAIFAQAKAALEAPATAT
jgi:large subunit ribosomal protein L20